MPESAVRPSTGSAEVHVLFGGYVDTDRSPWSVASPVPSLRDGDAQVIVDPGFVPSPASILDPLRDRGVSPQDITQGGCKVVNGRPDLAGRRCDHAACRVGAMRWGWSA